MKTNKKGLISRAASLVITINVYISQISKVNKLMQVSQVF